MREDDKRNVKPGRYGWASDELPADGSPRAVALGRRSTWGFLWHHSSRARREHEASYRDRRCVPCTACQFTITALHPPMGGYHSGSDGSGMGERSRLRHCRRACGVAMARVETLSLDWRAMSGGRPELAPRSLSGRQSPTRSERFCRRTLSKEANQKEGPHWADPLKA
jgi:hypothetical protein